MSTDINQQLLSQITPFSWRKLGKVFDPADHPGKSWMATFAQSPSAIVLDDKVRVFFCSRPNPSEDGLYVSYISFVDIRPENPAEIIDICEGFPFPLGDRGTFDEFGTNPVSVLQHNGKLWAYYAGWTRCESVPFNGAIGVAVSHDDGLSFHRVGKGPVLGYTPDEPFLIGSPRIRRFHGKWCLWYVAGKRWLRTPNGPEPVYKIRMAESEDGLDWKRVGKDLIADVLGENECQASADVTLVNNTYHMFFSYRHPENYKTPENGYRIGYANSSDGRKWHRSDALAGMHPSHQGWDSEMTSYPNVFEFEGETYMLYQGNGMGQTGFGIAILEKNSGWLT